MADIFPANRMFTVTTAQNGQVASYGSTSDEDPTGAWSFQFVPDPSFIGSFTIMGRSPRVSTSDTSVPWTPFPYRQVSVNNIAADYSVVSAAISGQACIQVPANGFAIGILIACTQGTATILANAAQGSSAP